LHTDQPAALRAGLGHWLAVESADADGVSFSLAGYPSPVLPKPDARHMASSFLVDFNEPAVQQLKADILRVYGDAPSTQDLDDFVFRHIDRKNGANGFDVASQVATSRSGDCTEHAVLLTAVLRLFGYPARTVLGLYVHLGTPEGAYGHAWSEYHDGSRWVGLDATNIDSEVGAHYIPIGVVEQEGLGYLLGLTGALQLMNIDRIVVQ
jgi:transglutaminase-like putative cysteine protease